MIRNITTLLAVGLLGVGCGPPPSPRTEKPPVAARAVVPEAVLREANRVTLGAPLAVAVDFGGVAFVADASPGRLVAFNRVSKQSQEFQAPSNRPGFYPTDVAVRGFFVYAIDEPGRLLLRFDNSGTYRDILLNFEGLADGRRVSPFGLAVDGAGRVAVTDVENHQVILFGNFLQVEVSFGNYGTYAGQLDTPQGVSFTPAGDLLVADTGNARLQIFDDCGAFKRVIPAKGKDNPLVRPRRAVMAEGGRVFVADPEAGRVFEFGADGSLHEAYVPAASPTGFEPTDVEITRDGWMYVTDTATRSLYVFKVM